VVLSAQWLRAPQLVLTLAYTAVLARLLSPRDFGLVALGTAVAGFLQVFRDCRAFDGDDPARGTLLSAQVSNLFWLNLGVAGIAGGSKAISAPLLAWFFREPSLARIAVTLSCQPSSSMVSRFSTWPC